MYKPRYATGQIIVDFHDGLGEDFAKDFGEKIGYKLSDDQPNEGPYVFETPPGKERKAVREFSRRQYDNFVEFADRRDLRLEERWSRLDRVVEMIEEFRDSNADFGTKEYNRELENIRNYLESIKEK